MIADCDILILGAGGAGLMAALAAAESAHAAGRRRRIVLVEKNRQAGIKVLVCGGGRGNLTNAGTREELLAAFGRTARWLADAFDRLDNAAVCRLFARLGVPTRTESDGRVFPVSDKARDLVDALLSRAVALGVEVHTGLAATEIRTEPAAGADSGASSRAPPRPERRVSGVVLVPADTPVPGRPAGVVPAKWRRFDPATWSHTAPQSTADELRRRAAAEGPIVAAARRIVLAVGGSSYTRMGTTGDGYRMCERLGHTVVAVRPAIVPLVTVQQWGTALAGVAVERAAVAIDLPRRRAGGTGDVLFTHFGLSGPAVLNLSDQAALLLAQGTSPVPLRLDLMPEATADELEERLRSAGAGEGRRRVSSLLAPRLPQRLVEYLLRAAGASPDLTVGRLPRAVRRALVEAVKGFRADVHATKGMSQAMVTAGGVALNEVDPATMESRKVAGLYLVGELLDLTGPSGGYNLQLAWSTGWVAGQQAEHGLPEAR